MLKNYFKIALRNLAKQKLTSSINVLGLAIGLTCCILVLLYVQYEISYDSFHKNGNSIYQIIWGQKASFDKELVNSTTLPVPFYEGIKSTFPEIVNSTKMQSDVSSVSFNSKTITKQPVIYADPSVLDMFSFPLLMGDKKTALNSPDKAAITEELSHGLFGNDNPIGKTVMLNRKPFIVSAVLKDVPSNSTLQFSAILPSEASPSAGRVPSWNMWSIKGFLQLPDNYSAEMLKIKLNEFVKNHLKKNLGEYNSVALQPFNRVHLHSMEDYGIETTGSITKVVIYSIISILTLLLACINFTNHSISLLSGRYKEVGIRKIVGADKRHIFAQFMSEIIITCSVSIVISFYAVYLLLPKFNFLVDKKITLDVTNVNILAILLLLIISCFAAGSYPALMVSKFKPAEVISKKLKLGYRNRFSTALLTVQFALSIFFFASLTIMSEQIGYLFTKHNINDSTSVIELSVNAMPGGNGTINSSVEYFRNELLKNKNVLYRTSGHGGGGVKELTCEGKELAGEISPVGWNYFETYGIKALKGRVFDLKNNPSDTSEAIVINSAFAQKNNLYSPVGKYIRLKENESFAKLREMNPAMFAGDPYPDKEFKIIGVVEDFTKRKLTQKYTPVIYKTTNQLNTLVSIRINNADIQNTISQIKDLYAKVFSGSVLKYTLLSESIEKIYSAELKEKELLQYVSFFVLLITVFGVFGFTFLNISKRIKEIGIRKVIGASVKDIFTLLTREYFFLFIIAAIISVPPAYYFMSKWMNDFVVKIPISVWYFIISGLIVCGMILLSISVHVIKTARANPIESLKYE